MGTTSNGRPWGENTGRVASGVFYGWTAKRGIEAAQRLHRQRMGLPDPPQPPPPPRTKTMPPPPPGAQPGLQMQLTETQVGWRMVSDAAKVSGLWVVYGALWIIQGWSILNASFMTFVNFFDPMQNGNWKYGLASLALSTPATVFTVRMISAGRALVARAEGLPPRKGERYLAKSWFPKKWWSMYLTTALAYQPFYLLMSSQV